MKLEAMILPVTDVDRAKAEGRTPGLHPGRSDYNSFATFSDPDGNGWILQEVRKDVR